MRELGDLILKKTSISFTLHVTRDANFCMQKLRASSSLTKGHLKYWVALRQNKLARILIITIPIFSFKMGLDNNIANRA